MLALATLAVREMAVSECPTYKLLLGSEGGLSDREIKVFRMVGQGKTMSYIAGQLGVSPKTVEAHREKIKTKLGLKNAAKVAPSPAARNKKHPTGFGQLAVGLFSPGAAELDQTHAGRREGASHDEALGINAG